VPKAKSLPIVNPNAFWSHLFHILDACHWQNNRASNHHYITRMEIMASPPTSTMHAFTGDLGFGQEGQQFGAGANEMRLCRGVGSVARIAEG
jgi:hypothetical protein